MVGDIAAIIAAVAFVLLVGLLAVPLLKLGKVLDEAQVTIRGLSDSSLPLIGEVTTTVGHANHQLEKVDVITSRVSVISENGAQVATNVGALTSLFAATLGSPLVRVAAFSYGVREAVNARREGKAAGARARVVDGADPS